jgi:type I restriction enzyme R subunit
MNPNDETEADTRADRIDPVLSAAGWGTGGSKVRREVICPGRIQTGGKRGKGLSSDYVLIYKGQKLAVIEAKKAGISHREGIGQAKNYATHLGARFAYATNGRNWYAIDMATGKEGELALPFPTPDQLWNARFADEKPWRERFGAVEFETDGGKWELRYYQHNAINAALEAVAKGSRRILLTLATGTGKTSIAFQITWKLFHAKWNQTGEPTRRPRILFLADRNILADQAYNSFSAFPNDAITRIDPDTIRKNHGKPPKNASIFFTIFQTFMTGEDQPIYTQYPPDFFDFIIIDECHRGGAKDESEWHALLEYFEPATQLGLTATPKRKVKADTYSYFREPVYTYALRDGIEDGFLTPFKVRQMASTIDEYVFDGTDEVIGGDVEIGETFGEGDINTRVIIPERELSRVQEFMAQIDQRQKTLVFCATQAHAALVRDQINQVKTSTNPDYCHRVTADDGAVGEQHLRDFQDNDKTIPTILTTSQKLSTGVDARNVRNIVIMRPIKSMIEFKQIIGRGTRTYEGKDFFTIWDFVRAHENFQDPEWDGEPLEPEPRPERPDRQEAPDGPQGVGEEGDDFIDDRPLEKIEIKLADGKARSIQYLQASSYWFDGRPITAQEFLKKLFGDLSGMIADEDELRSQWRNPETRERLLGVLADKGYDEDRLADMRQLVDAKDSDLFDVLAYVRFSLDPLSLKDRAKDARDFGLSGYEGEMRTFLNVVLANYEKAGEAELTFQNLTNLLSARYGTVADAKAKLGEVALVRKSFADLQTHLYQR